MARVAGSRAATARRWRPWLLPVPAACGASSVRQCRVPGRQGSACRPGSPRPSAVRTQSAVPDRWEPVCRRALRARLPPSSGSSSCVALPAGLDPVRRPTAERTGPAGFPTGLAWGCARRRTVMLWLIRLLLVVLGILAIAAGVIYLVEPIHSLPAFFPGHALRGLTHHHIRGYIAIAVGVVLLILAGIARRSRRPRPY